MKNTDTRVENDSMGAVTLPSNALYGPQTQRAIDNFLISQTPMPWKFIASVILIKQVAAETNMQLGLLSEDHAKSICDICTTLLEEEQAAHFPVSVYQTGSGTSTNMNVNEVIARMAELNGVTLSPNDHVNLGQSSNDVIPTAIHLSSVIELTGTLLPAVNNLVLAIRKKGNEYKDVIKTGRTHLMDALPISVYNEFEAWAVQLEEGIERIESCSSRLVRLPLGGTAIGSGVNCHPDFPEKAIYTISKRTGIEFTAALSRYKGLSSMDTALELSGHLKNLAMSLFKIANDLRWMNSGPLSGIGEIQLPALQPGSSIMPAKVNPVIPEAVCMAASQVAGYDTAITFAAQSGNFQLNTMLPLIAANLLESISIMAGSCNTLADKAILGLKIDAERCGSTLMKNPILVTALNPEIGYLRAAEIAKIAASENRSVLDVAREHTDIDERRLMELLNPKKMARGNE